MHHTHNLLCRFAGGLFFFFTLCLAPSLAQIVFDGSPGTNAPPGTLGPYTMTPFAPDLSPLGNNVMMVMTPNGCPANASIMFNPMLRHARPGNGWGAWSHGYTGDVYSLVPGTNATITLPAGTAAFYFYAQPDQFGSFTIQANANDGTTSGPIPVQGLAGAQYYGFYTTGTTTLSSITINVAAGAGGFAVGEFGISCQPVVPVVPSFPSDQKAGSLLVFPYYTSRAVDGRDTRITISNINSTTRTTTAVHVFFIDGNTCYQQDMFLCLTPNASVSLKTSEYDPEVTGFMYALAVHPTTGVPIPNNVLIGNAFVRDGEYIGNYGAESFWSYGQTRGGAVLDPFNSTATLTFGAAYDGAPTELGVEIQSPVDKAGQKLVLAPLAGDLTYFTPDSENLLYTAAAQLGSGLAFNEQEKAASYSSMLTGTCQRSTVITTSHPRVPNTLATLIRSGQAGWLRFKVTAAVGLLMTPRNNNNTWNGIRNLHKTATGKATLQVSIFPPVC